MHDVFWQERPHFARLKAAAAGQRAQLQKGRLAFRHVQITHDGVIALDAPWHSENAVGAQIVHRIGQDVRAASIKVCIVVARYVKVHDALLLKFHPRLVRVGPAHQLRQRMAFVNGLAVFHVASPGPQRCDGHGSHLVHDGAVNDRVLPKAFVGVCLVINQLPLRRAHAKVGPDERRGFGIARHSNAAVPESHHCRFDSSSQRGHVSLSKAPAFHLISQRASGY